MRPTPLIKPVIPQIRRPFLSATRAWVAVLGVIVLVLLGLIGRDTILAKPVAAPLRLATASSGTVKVTVTGSGSLAPASQTNVGFRSSGQITEIDVKVGDAVKTGQVLARIDPSAQQAALNQANATLASAQSNLQSIQSPLSGAQLTQLRHAVTAAQQNYNDTVNQANAQNQADGAVAASDRAKLALDCPTNATACAQDQSQLSSDLSKQHQDQAANQARVDSAAQQITAARDTLAVQAQAKPGALPSAQAQVASAAAQVQAAQVALNQTTLTAPSSGVVISINGEVGEVASTGGGTTAQAPGTIAPQPSSASGSSSSGGSAFMVLEDTSSFDAVIPFAETDAIKLAPNQPASISFDAITTLTISGHVLSVDPNATVVSNVVNYYVTFVLNQSDPRLKAGMTANASVTAAEADNAVTVPNAAVRTTGGTPMVTVYSGGQQVATEVETGLVGDTTTEIKGGLKAGDQVVLPALTVSTGTTTGGGGSLFGGGGGVRIGGGGGGRTGG